MSLGSSIVSRMLLACVSAIFACAASAASLRVCADPHNLPFSNSQGQGFENRLAQIVAHDLGRSVQYVWASQRGQYLRDTLDARRCDVVMGVPSSLPAVQTTHPYYRSSYVFVWRRDRHLEIHSFDDAALQKTRIGVHVIGEDGATVPAAQALIDRGLLQNITWYRLYPDFQRPDPPSALIKAVARGEIDVAVAWGPMAGYFTRNSAVPLKMVPVSPQYERLMPLVFDISMGVRRGEASLALTFDQILARKREEIRQLLRQYGVPLVEGSDLANVREGKR